MAIPNEEGVYTLTAHDKFDNEVWVVFGSIGPVSVGVTIFKRNENGEIIGFGDTRAITISRNELVGFATEILTAASQP